MCFTKSLYGGLEHCFDFPFHIWDIILPIDKLIFFKMVETTNQMWIYSDKWGNQDSSDGNGMINLGTPEYAMLDYQRACSQCADFLVMPQHAG